MFSYYVLQCWLVVTSFLVITILPSTQLPADNGFQGFPQFADSDLNLNLIKKLNRSFWEDKAAAALRERFRKLRTRSNFGGKPAARNVILFVGDGLGISTVTALRKFKEEYSGEPFYNSELTWDSFPFSGFSKTYELDNVIADSAASATAILTGVKTKDGWIALDSTADPKCETSKGHLESIAHWAHRSGKAAGFVTTTSVTHGSPAPLYANTPLRAYEFHNYKHAVSYPKCVDIARQLLTKGHHLKVVLGGGRAYFTPDTYLHPGDPRGGFRSDGRNIVEEWLRDRNKMGANASYVATLEQLRAIDSDDVGYLLGLFNHEHFRYYDDNPPASQPRLEDMTEAAIKILSKNDKGFFLFVESGLIDHGHHRGIARYALTEGIELDRAVKKALSLVDLSETLIIVTADHSHTLTIGGSLPHESSILGLNSLIAKDSKPFTALLYANGPGASVESGRDFPELEDTSKPGYLQQALIPLKAETHGGEDVPVYAAGVYSELFSGVFEQSYLAWAIACAAGMDAGPAGSRISVTMSTLCPTSASLSNSHHYCSSAMLAISASLFICRYFTLFS